MIIGTGDFEKGISLHYGFTPDLKKNGFYTIHVRFWLFQKDIRLKETEVSTGIRCSPDKWTGESVKGKDLGTQSKNERLDNVKKIIRSSLHDMEKLEISSINELMNEINTIIKPKINPKTSKIKKEKHLSRLEKHKVNVVKDDYLSTKKLSDSYKRWFNVTCHLLTEYLGHTPKVDELTLKHMEGFKIWLEDVKDYKHNTIQTTLNRLRTILNYAATKGYISKSPMPKKGLIKDYKRGERQILNKDEIIQICKVSDNELSLSQVKIKYLFLFMVSTAMGYGELQALNTNKIIMVDRKFYLKKNREKTGEPFEIAFSPLATQVYLKVCELGVTFKNIPSIDFMNRSLKKLMKLAGVEKRVTSYVGRHTFATHWLADGNDINTLKTIMGHSDIRTTQIYEGLIPEKVIKAQYKAYMISDFHNMTI